jgi:predicted NAD/FAD-dependent oxidoreductase
MSALGKNLAGVLPRGAIRLETKVTGVRWQRDHWEAEVEDWPYHNWPLSGRRLVLALPVPQALALLGPPESLDANPLISHGALRQLRRVETAPALAVLLRGPAAAPEWRGIQLRDATLAWIGDDTSKRALGKDGEVEAPPAASAGERIFVLHGSADFSRQWQDADLQEAARRMVARAGEIAGDWITRLPGRQVHRWRYASVPRTVEDLSAIRGTGGLGAPLYFAGDAFLGGKIEGACRSGLVLGRELIEEMKRFEARPKPTMPFPFER